MRQGLVRGTPNISKYRSTAWRVLQRPSEAEAQEMPSRLKRCGFWLNPSAGRRLMAPRYSISSRSGSKSNRMIARNPFNCEMHSFAVEPAGLPFQKANLVDLMFIFDSTREGTYSTWDIEVPKSSGA